jgi:hypothetical protein
MVPVPQHWSLLALKTLIEDFWAQVKAIRPSAKWSMLFLTCNHRSFSPLDTILNVLDSDLALYSQYGSGSRGAILIQIRKDPDPDTKHWSKLKTFL